jgi:predicted nuclease of predicted toxin-antitoxin system
MRLLVNENVPGPVVRGLRDLGHDVLWAKEDLPGEPDHVLLSRAQTEHRVTVTCDTDFGELAFRSGLPAECGVVLLRIQWSDPIADNAFAVSTLTSRAEWTGVFAVVEHDRIRVRPLPKRTSNQSPGGI